MDEGKDHNTEAERARAADLLRIMPEGRQTVLEIGARDGYITRVLTSRFPAVTALDLEKPDFDISGVVNIQGNVTKLDFPDDSFDAVVCTEVLEHVPELRRAAGEIGRVARHEVIIGVPYRQDIRVGRTTCRSCGGINPPWGHVNSFDEQLLFSLFPQFDLVLKSFVGESRSRTNALSTWLSDLAGNPWGTYNQDECCIHCAARLIAPASQTGMQKMLFAASYLIERIQSPLIRPRAGWIHMVFRKR